jgi:hypothetical protein
MDTRGIAGIHMRGGGAIITLIGITGGATARIGIPLIIAD